MKENVMLPCYIVYIAIVVTIIHEVSNEDVSLSNIQGNNTSNYNMTSNQTKNDDDVLTLDINSLEDLCTFFEIPPEDCSCDLAPDLCQVLNDPIFKDEFVMHPTANIILTIFSTVSLVFGIVGNSAVLAVSFSERKIIQKSQVLITHLAFVDLICCIGAFVNIVHYYWTYKWQLGLHMCKLLNVVITLGTLLPVGFMLIIALERYFGILHPLRKNLMGTKMTNLLVSLNIIVGTGSVIPLYFPFQIDENGICEEKWRGGMGAEVIYYWYLMLFYFLLPISVTAALYGVIVRSLAHQLTANTAVSRADIMVKRRKSNNRIMKILISLVAAYVVCLLPTRVSWLYMVYTERMMSHIVYGVLVYINNLTFPLHTCVNPIIYSIIDAGWRKKVLKIIGLRRKDRVIGI